MFITSVSLGLLHRNKDFPTSLEQANKMISRVLLLVPSFTKKKAFKNLWIFKNNTQVFHPMYSMLYNSKFRLAELCRVFADLVTYIKYKEN